MAGQLSAVGAQMLANKIGGIVPPALVSGIANAPAWKPGLEVIDYSVTPPVRYVWNTQAWVAASSMGLYLALLTGDPSQSGPGGGYAQNISDLLEDQTAGYARQSVTFAEPATPGYPATISNTNVITFGPYTAAQANPVNWAALVTASSGQLGLLLYMWQLPSPQQVNVSQSIQIAAGAATLSES